MKTSELTGPDLDLWVAKAEGYKIGKPLKPHADGAQLYPFAAPTWTTLGAVMRMADGSWSENMPRFSTDWAVGGPIIYRKNIATSNHRPGGMAAHPEWSAKTLGGSRIHFGPTPLIAAMRAYVASEYGDELPEVE